MDIIENALNEEEDCLDNMPENLQDSDRCSNMEDAIDNMENSIELIEEAIEYLNKAIE